MSESVTLVKKKSPVEDASSFLFKWDSVVREHYLPFEEKKLLLTQGINSLYHNVLTSFRDPVQFSHRYD